MDGTGNHHAKQNKSDWENKISRFLSSDSKKLTTEM
jgi:hypothetical protein